MNDFKPTPTDPVGGDVSAAIVGQSSSHLSLAHDAATPGGLSAAIRSSDRSRPIVAFRLPGGAPLELTLDEAQAIVEVAAEVYFVTDRCQSRDPATLEGGVPLKLARASAWIWWPTAGRSSRNVLTLADQIALSRPAASAELGRIASRLAESERAVEDLQFALDAAALDADCKATALQIAERCMLDAWTKLQLLSDLGVESEDLAGASWSDRLRWLIFREWMRLNPDARQKRPLVYVFGPEFVQSAERHTAVETRLAWACASVAGGVRRDGLKLRAVGGRSEGRTGQPRRADGATAWEAIVETEPSVTGARRGLALLYWAHRSGCVEFARVAHHVNDSPSQLACELRRLGICRTSRTGEDRRRSCPRGL